MFNLRERERERERERLQNYKKFEVFKDAFVSAVNGIRKIFYTTGRVWVGQKIQSNGK